ETEAVPGRYAPPRRHDLAAEAGGGFEVGAAPRAVGVVDEEGAPPPARLLEQLDPGVLQRAALDGRRTGLVEEIGGAELHRLDAAARAVVVVLGGVEIEPPVGIDVGAA